MNIWVCRYIWPFFNFIQCFGLKCNEIPACLLVNLAVPPCSILPHLVMYLNVWPLDIKVVWVIYSLSLLHFCFIYSYETRKNGLVLLYDMTGSGYHNFDYGLARKVMELLKVTLHLIKCWNNFEILTCMCTILYMTVCFMPTESLILSSFSGLVSRSMRLFIFHVSTPQGSQ